MADIYLKKRALGATWRTISLSFCLLALPGLAGCGPIRLGGNPVQENEPSGTIVAQKEFTGQSGKTVSGSAVVYYVSPGTYTLRLSNVVFPSETGLQLIAVVNSQNQSPVSLRAVSGSQNYPFTFNAVTVQWNQVRIHSTFANQDYAVAIFPVVTTNP